MTPEPRDGLKNQAGHKAVFLLQLWNVCLIVPSPLLLPSNRDSNGYDLMSLSLVLQDVKCPFSETCGDSLWLP
jgi:hypothetical protein